MLEHLRSRERRVETVCICCAQLALYHVRLLTYHQREVVRVMPFVRILKRIHIAQTRTAVIGRNRIAHIALSGICLAITIAAVIGGRTIETVGEHIARLVAQFHFQRKVLQELILHIAVQGQFIIHLVLIVMVYRCDRVIQRTERLIVRLITLEQLNRRVGNRIAHTALGFRTRIVCRIRSRAQHLRIAIASRYTDGQSLQWFELTLERQVVAVVVRTIHDTLIVYAVVTQVERCQLITTRQRESMIGVQAIVPKSRLLPIRTLRLLAPIVNNSRQIDAVITA